MSTITLERLTRLYPGGRGVLDLDRARRGVRVHGPFHYAEAARVIQTGGLPAGTLVLVAVVLAAIGTACLLFERKDIHA